MEKKHVDHVICPIQLKKKVCEILKNNPFFFFPRENVTERVKLLSFISLERDHLADN